MPFSEGAVTVTAWAMCPCFRGLQVLGLKMSISGCFNLETGGGCAEWKLRNGPAGPELRVQPAGCGQVPASAPSGPRSLPRLLWLVGRPNREQAVNTVTDTLR